MIKTIKENLIFKNKFLEIYNNNVLFKKSKSEISEGEHFNIIRPNTKGGLYVMPLDQYGNVIIQKEFRYAYNEYLLSLVAGGVENELSVEENVIKELKEEIQCNTKTKNLINLGKFVESPSVMFNYVHLYVAENVFFDDSIKSEESEIFKDRQKIPFDKFYNMCLQNEIICPYTQLIAFKYKEIINNKS